MPKFIGDDNNVFAERMLEKGFFPENMPPVFRIENLHEASLVAIPSSTYITDKTTEACKHNASKRGNQRRIFAMPNPTFMVDSAIFFINHQDEVDEFLSSSVNSSSYPNFSVDGARAISISGFPEFHKRRRKDLAKSRYVVKTDISRFYHSIYTHAIPWALHGKHVAKKDRKINSANVYGNKLDWIARQSQDGQTVGLPVGPDFSRIIAEIISVAIDANFRSTCGADVPMLRLVDDIYIGCDDLDQANEYLSAMRESIRGFELDVNENKTLILNASEDIEAYWPVEIRREIERFKFNFRSRGRVDFVHFLDEIFRIYSVNKDDGIVKYAIKKFDENGVWVKYWELLEPFLIRVAINVPHCIDYVARVVVWRHRKSGVDTPLWVSVIHKIIARHVKYSNDTEVLWALWLLKELGGEIHRDAFEDIVRKSSVFSCLVAMDIHSKSGSYRLPRELILDRIGDLPMMGASWLLAYEGDRQFGLKIKTRNLQGNSFFKQMYDDYVSFYDPDALPFVFDDLEEGEEVDSAIEDLGGGYDDLYEDEDEDEDEGNDL